MPLRRAKRLATNFIVALTASTMTLASPALAACHCDDSGSPMTAHCQPGCHCSTTCGQQSPSSCCTPNHPANSADGSGCTCSTGPEQLPAPSKMRGDETRTVSSLFLPSDALPGNSGLHGAAWDTAFDLAATGGPSGLRLHALLSVWRI